MLISSPMIRAVNSAGADTIRVSSSAWRPSLSHAAIKEIYNDYRSVLIHNATVAVGSGLLFAPAEHELFPVRNHKRFVNVFSLHNKSVDAVEAFLAKGLIESSKVVETMRLKL
jgi:hypothetical protein